MRQISHVVRDETDCRGHREALHPLNDKVPHPRQTDQSPQRTTRIIAQHKANNLLGKGRRDIHQPRTGLYHSPGNRCVGGYSCLNLSSRDRYTDADSSFTLPARRSQPSQAAGQNLRVQLAPSDPIAPVLGAHRKRPCRLGVYPKVVVPASAVAGFYHYPPHAIAMMSGTSICLLPYSYGMSSGIGKAQHMTERRSHKA